MPLPVSVLPSNVRKRRNETVSFRAGERRSTEDGMPSEAGAPGTVQGRDSAICDATLALLVEVGYDRMSMDAVAARARASKATIYRRWPGKEALLVDAVSRLKRPLPELAGRSVREDLVTLLRSYPRRPDQRLTRILSTLVPEVHRSPERYRLYQSLVEPRRQALREVLQRGVRTGELRPDADVEAALAVLMGPVLIQRMLRWHPDLPEASLPERVVDIVLSGLAAD
jgi:AcrR family transcriptional regulator